MMILFHGIDETVSSLIHRIKGPLHPLLKPGVGQSPLLIRDAQVAQRGIDSRIFFSFCVWAEAVRDEGLWG